MTSFFLFFFLLILRAQSSSDLQQKTPYSKTNKTPIPGSGVQGMAYT